MTPKSGPKAAPPVMLWLTSLTKLFLITASLPAATSMPKAPKVPVLLLMMPWILLLCTVTPPPLRRRYRAGSVPPVVDRLVTVLPVDVVARCREPGGFADADTARTPVVRVIPRLFTVLPDTVALPVPVASQMPVSFSPSVLLKLPTVFWLTVAPRTPCM